MRMRWERCREIPGQQLCIDLKNNRSLVEQKDGKIQKGMCSKGRVETDRMLYGWEYEVYSERFYISVVELGNGRQWARKENG